MDLNAASKTNGQVGAFRYGVLGAFEDEASFEMLDDESFNDLLTDGCYDVFTNVFIVKSRCRFGS